MNINTQDIVDLISSQTGQTKKFSEQFFKELVSVISEYLQKDGFVKVKGLGTFKVIKVEARKSVDVATGNEIILPEHNKVQFLPEEAVKQQVNAPFAHLETVVTAPKQETPAPEPVAPEPVAQEPVKPAPEPAPASAPELAPASAPEPAKPAEEAEPKKKKSLWWISIVVLLVLLLAAYFTKQYWQPYTEEYVVKIEKLCGIERHVIEPDTAIQEETDTLSQIPMQAADEALTEYQDSVSAEQAAAFLAPDTVTAAALQDQPFDINSYTPQMAMNAPIRGYETIRQGTRLVMVSLRAYGSKDFWVYIYDANRSVMRAPNDVPIGTKVAIPDLPKELVDPNSPEAVQFAKNLAKKY